jgi:hypothetical protein
MTEITVTSRASGSGCLTVEKSVYSPGAFLALLGGRSAHLSVDETRELRDELNKLLGVDEATPVPKLGDRVQIVQDYAPDSSSTSSRWDGRTGVLDDIDREDDRYPYRVDLGYEGSRWVHSVRVVVDEPEDEPAYEVATAEQLEAREKADFDRRSDAAAKARELLAGSSSPIGVQRPAPEDVIRLAAWLLGADA